MVVPISRRLDYVQLKLAILREYLSEKKYDAVLLQREDNISWLTCEVLNVFPYNLLLEKFAFLVTKDQFFLIANNPEILRIIVEDLAGMQLTVVPISVFGSIEKEVDRIIGSEKVASDTEIGIFQTETLQLEELRFSILK
jgi:hypothetical protein